MGRGGRAAGRASTRGPLVPQVSEAAQALAQTVAERHPEDCQTLGQYLQTHCFNLHRQCKNPKCREGVLRHEQCFSHHGGRFSLRVQQVGSPADRTPWHRT
eukprot:4022647-Prymnesium_polylepis.1